MKNPSLHPCACRTPSWGSGSLPRWCGWLDQHKCHKFKWLSYFWWLNPKKIWWNPSLHGQSWREIPSLPLQELLAAFGTTSCVQTTTLQHFAACLRTLSFFIRTQKSNETMSCLRSLFGGFLAGPPNHPNHLNHLNHLTIHDLVLKPMTWGSSNFKKPPFSHLPSGYLT